MKKNFLKVGLLSILVLLLCTACDGNVTRDIRHAGFSVGGEFVCSVVLPQTKEDTSYSKIRWFTGTHMILEDGRIYELSLGQKFTNQQHCKEALTSLRVKAILDNRIIKATDNKYYYLVGENTVAPYSEVPDTDNNYYIYDLLLRDENTVKVMTADSSLGLYYLLFADGNVYADVLTKVDRNSPPVITSTQIVYNKSDYGAKIVDFNYAGESLATYVKTDYKTYRLRMSNADQCTKYADIRCEFQMQEDPIFEQYKDRIITYNGSMLVVDYGKTFSVAS